MFRSMLLWSMLLFFCPDILAQQRSHSLTHDNLHRVNVPDTLTIVAVRVEFQADNNRLTTGDGTFDAENLSYLDDSKITIDPLPHNQSYFESHLLFAKNYFESVSGHQINVKYRILPDIYQLPKKMEAYSPTGESFTNEKIAQLVGDTWQEVEQQGGFSTSDLDPQKTVFVIFHGGVGRDIELIGTTLDKTPQDIPSLFLGKLSLSRLLQDPDFDGFDVNDGTFKVTNSIVVPRTLSRPGEDVSGQPYVLQLSLNGLLCASVGSYLGLPDLFNTQTGTSGIGRFGLMDGESFFSYRGLFPPEPSAWEKTYLGWQNPFSITANTADAVSLPAASLHQPTSIAKYNLSTAEYFLVENRHRDPNKTGITLSIRQPDGKTTQQHFDNYDDAFINQTEGFTDGLARGVVTDVSNFDWSLPGGLDPGPDKMENTSDDRQLNGGVLIWHIDEAVIQNELQSQTVNANSQRRGVDLEEADGAQDIGRATNNNFSSKARGTAFDFWWSGNNASVIALNGDTLSFYENRFGPDTRPSNDSNSGAPSFFELYDFSDNQAVATFRIRPYSTNNIKAMALPIDSLADHQTFTAQNAPYFSSYPLGLTLFKTQSDSFLIVPSQQSTYAINLNNATAPVFDFQSGLSQQPYTGNNLILGNAPLTSKVQLTAWQWDGSTWSPSWNTQINANDAFLSSVDDQILLPDFTTQRLNITTGALLSPSPEATQRSASLDDQYTTLSDNTLHLAPNGDSYSFNNSGKRSYTGAIELTKDKTAFYLLTDKTLSIFDPDHFSQPRTIVQNTPLDWPAMVDLNDDRRLDFIYINKSTHQLEARNLQGAMLSYFPVLPPDGTAFIGTPLIVQTTSGTPEIFITARDSLSMNIYGYSTTGEPLPDFPLYVGSVSSVQNQPVHPLINEKTLFAVSHLGELKAWHLDNIKSILWGSRYGNNPQNKISGTLPDGTTGQPTTPEQILVKKETYNWPNPAHDFTHLRYQTNKAGQISVKIITTGGTVIFEKKVESNGGTPEEFRLSTQNWSSGLYLGMITATVNGQKAHKMIKIVVVH